MRFSGWLEVNRASILETNRHLPLAVEDKGFYQAPLMKQRISVMAAAITLAATLAACGTNTEDVDRAGPSRPTATATEKSDRTVPVSEAHNDADTNFAQKMISYNKGAIEMADLASQQATTEEVRDLTDQVSAVQSSQIEKLTTWLFAWDEDFTLSDNEERGILIEGLNLQEAIDDLKPRSGVDFDKRFLELMTAHHEGVIQLAKDERVQGQNLDALNFAQQIIEDQEIEIERMAQLLNIGFEEGAGSSSWL